LDLAMIELYKLNGTIVFVNPDLIRVIEATPDTVLSFLDGDKMMVRDRPQEIIEKIVSFRRRCQSAPVLVGKSYL
jgi:flagellar protein FlbD